MRILIEPRRSLRATRGARGARGQAWLRLCPFRVLQNEWSSRAFFCRRVVMMGSNTGVADRVTEGVGDADALGPPGLIDRCRDDALPDAADVVSGSGVARLRIGRGGTSDEREGGSELDVASGSVSVASTSSARSIAQGVSPPCVVDSGSASVSSAASASDSLSTAYTPRRVRLSLTFTAGPSPSFSGTSTSEDSSDRPSSESCMGGPYPPMPRFSQVSQRQSRFPRPTDSHGKGWVTLEGSEKGKRECTYSSRHRNALSLPRLLR